MDVSNNVDTTREISAKLRRVELLTKLHLRGTGCHEIYLPLWDHIVNHCATDNVNHQWHCQKHFIGGAVYRQFESEAPASEILDRVICNSEQFSFQMCLESMVMAAELFATGDREFQTAASWCHDAECFGVKVDPRCRLIE